MNIAPTANSQKAARKQEVLPEPPSGSVPKRLHTDSADSVAQNRQHRIDDRASDRRSPNKHSKKNLEIEPTLDRTGMGFDHGDGRFGTRNDLGVISTVNCSASVCHAVAGRFDDERMKQWPSERLGMGDHEFVPGMVGPTLQLWWATQSSRAVSARS